MFMSDSKFAEYQKQAIERMAYDLQSVIGKSASCNYSPTLQSKLISINKETGMCILEVTPSRYDRVPNVQIGHQYEQAIQLVHNGYFY